MTKKRVNMRDLKSQIRKDLGLNEAYVTASKKFDLNTELLSQKAKKAHSNLYDDYSDKLNVVSAQLDVAERESANPNYSYYRCLKQEEIHNLNGSYLHTLHFDNISDLNSVITMDSITFLRLERDFGTFEDWQKDFIACALSARNGWALTVYSTVLGRYLNIMIDGNTSHIPVGCFPIFCLCVNEAAYFRDYLDDRKSYIYAMMKEVNWNMVEGRVKDAERIAKLLSKGAK